MVRICKTCGDEKPLESFAKNSSCKEGRAYSCKNCLAEYAREYKAKNKEKVSTSEYKSQLKTKYGLTEEDYINILIKQNYSCAICGTHQSNLTKRLHVDHCHKTMKIRGLLCRDCNKTLGIFEDNIERFQKAIDYLNQ